MPFSSYFPSLDIPQTNLLTYLTGDESTVLQEPIWHDASDPENNLSPKQLLGYAKRLAIGLDTLGIGKGEVILIYTPNHIFVPAVYLGVTGSCRVFSGANPTYTEHELAHQIVNTKASALFVHPSLVKSAIAASKAKGSKVNGRIYLFSDVQNEPISGVQDWRQLLASTDQAEKYVWKRMTAEESKTTVATVNFSSGTTGLPKGVMITHANIIANVEQTIFCRYHKKKRTPERWLAFLPLYHVYGQLYTVLIATKLRIPVYVMKAFVYEEFLKAVQRYRITDLQVAPPILVMLAKRPETEKYDLSSVGGILCGAAPLSRELQNEVSERFNVQINQGWGMTEVTCTGMIVPGGIADDSGSLGPLVPNTEAKIIDDSGNEVTGEEPGELYIRGPQVCLGYWANEEATKEAIAADGWLKTGDVVKRNDKGWYWCVDRKKELIKVNGLQVAPAELEASLLQNDNIEDAACVGVTLHGEEWPRAYVTLKDHAKGRVSEKDIQTYIQSQLSKHKWLVGGVCFVDEVPRLPSGKIQRKVMREWAKRDAPALEAHGPLRAKL